MHKKKKKSLSIQANPGKSHITKKGHGKKLSWRAKLFQFIFKLIEILGSLCGIISFICELFKK